jgi:tRNA-splicing ligase RtcB
MKARELKKLGLNGAQIRLTTTLCEQAGKAGLRAQAIRDAVSAVIADPSAHRDDPHFGALATMMTPGAFNDSGAPAPWKQWGKDLDPQSIRQMENACRLPVAVRAALMPDAHVGYGLPIGGVLATRDAVIPYAVGVDIACRMRLSIVDMPADAIKLDRDRLIKVLEEQTRFGMGACFAKPHDHPVMSQDWNITWTTKNMKQKARSQLGSSGSGNHFVEWGVVTLAEPDLGLEPGEYLALLSHSGSRGAGATVADYYSKLAQDLHPELPDELRHLAWLDMNSEPGQEYWAAMNLMGDYAAANHAVIHREMLKALGVDALHVTENHHNFCWKEEHDGEDVYVHRKGATPAGEGVMGIIPGSMATPAYVVRGLGSDDSLRSASHGAGRVMSRRAAHQSVDWKATERLLAERDVTLLSAGIDEAPAVYKNIHDVMNAQQDLVDIVARFMPRIVKMAPSGEPPED